ncbi:PRC-barrel domain containing protein [Altererythrobacter xixiisoli]|uniref:PRC-barrel domain containing protein n=1 Tax=Croceibacterium xixiisoli TaxID=1476466 RepID=A0A6I4TZ74_9SPHN|nr:PRC-barrel domain-containing protein [Croceibacterium xixiisoli]MXP00621.1 PRC-barrel domain containing protein [Croceibacterium xixiisoli]
MATNDATGTKPLISALVDDTSVYGADGHKIGTLHSFHIERWKGQVEYAVIATGGLLGIGQSYHPIPFRLLNVNQEKGGYTMAIDRAVLDGGPNYRPDSMPQWDADYAQRVSAYFNSQAPGGQAL